MMVLLPLWVAAAALLGLRAAAGRQVSGGGAASRALPSPAGRRRAGGRRRAPALRSPPGLCPHPGVPPAAPARRGRWGALPARSVPSLVPSAAFPFLRRAQRAPRLSPALRQPARSGASPALQRAARPLLTGAPGTARRAPGPRRAPSLLLAFSLPWQSAEGEVSTRLPCCPAGLVPCNDLKVFFWPPNLLGGTVDRMAHSESGFLSCSIYAKLMKGSVSVLV